MTNRPIFAALRRLRMAMAAAAMMASGSAYANLIEYSFTSTSGQQRTLPADAKYANPVGNMTFAVSGGIDRRVRLSILSKDGNIIDSKTSHLLGADDRINVSGNEYYGVYMDLNAPSQGEYSIQTDILASDGVQIKSDSYPFIVDLSPPTITGSVHRVDVGQGYVTDVITARAWGEQAGDGGTIKLDGISDAESGISSVVFFATDKHGVRRYVNPSFNEQEGHATIGTVQITQESLTPYEDSPYNMGFMVTDKAGNKSESSRDIGVDRKVPEYTVRKIKNTKTGEWEIYSPGMTIYSNPVTVRYQHKKSDHVTHNGSLYGWADGRYNASDSEHIYYDVSFDYPQKYRYFVFRTKAGAYQQERFPAFDFTLAPGVPLGTNPKRIEYRLSDGTWVDSHTSRYAHPYTVDRIRFFVEPRSYQQKAWLQGFSPCYIAAGGESCVSSVSVSRASGRGYAPLPWYVARSDGEFSNHGGYLYTYWDMNKPLIDDLSVSNEKGKVILRVIDNDRVNNWQINMWDTKSFSAEVKGGSNTYSLNQISYAETDYKTKNVEFTLKDVPDGVYSLVVEAVDTYGNSASKSLSTSVLVDNTPPLVSINSSGGDAHFNSISSLDEIYIHVDDNYDAAPTIANIRLEGGAANDEVQLSWREESPGAFRLEYPIMFPSLKEGEEYTLTVVARDAHRNESVEEVSFIYDPPQVALQGGVDGKLMIPAVQHEFKHLDGRRIIETQPLTLADGSTVAGTYDVFASLRSDAEVPLVVNGVRIEPGDTTQIMSRHDFGASEGRLSLPLAAAEHGLEGMSSLLVSTAAPNAPVLLLDVHTWMGEAQLSAEAWTVRQVIDPVRISATPKSGAMCRFTAAESEARSADPIHDPVCYLQWEALPDETEPVALTDGGANTPKAEGQAVVLGEQDVAYSLWLFSGDGSKVKVGEGRRPVSVASPYGSVTLRPREDYSAVDRILHEFDLRLTQGGGPACSLTLSASEAIEAAANRKHDAQRLTCLLDWQEMPDGLSQKGGTHQPQLLGRLAENGEHTLGWRTSVFSKSGTRVTLNHETTTLTVVDPEAPKIRMTPSRHTTRVDDGRFVVPIAGSYFGDVEINTLPTEVDVRLERDDSVLEAETYGSGWSSRNILTRRLQAEGAALWEESEHRVSARYHRVPDIETAVTYRTVTGPAANLYPTIALAATEVLDNEPLPIEVAIQDVFNPSAGYNPAIMGEWDVRLVNQRSLSDLEPLTDWHYAEDGASAFTLDLEGRDNASMRLLAQARLRSPIAGYERTELSQRPTFLTVLRGGALDGNVEIRTLSGEAPFIAVFQLGFENRLDQAAMGDVHWEVSDDDGASWTQYPAGERRKTLFMRTFEEGVYQVRAHLTNRHSGLESYTEAVEVIAYPVPKLNIQGPQTVFVGDSWTYAVELGLPEGTAAQPEDVVIEWSEDGGQSWPHSGPTLTLTRDHEDRIGLRARARTSLAPETDRDAYAMDRLGVEFRDVHPPRARVRGPLRVEPGQPYTFTATVSPPYRGMAYAIEGYFTLPDGTVVENVKEVEYTPTAEDVEQERVEIHYTGWFVGYQAETTVEASHRTTAWEYVWPTFYALDRLSADVAPAEISLSIRHRTGTRRLEEPSYTWTLPDEATRIEAKGDAKRVFWLMEPGVYPVEVVVRDGRGHEAVVVHEIVLGRPAPYDIELDYTASNRYERAPLDVRVRPSVRGGHPRDRIIGHRYYHNGEVITEGSMYGTTTLEAGTHYLLYELETQMGTTARQILPIEVAVNQIPVCALEVSETSRDWRVSADCQDPDGRVREYQWTVDGEPSGRSGYRLSVNKRDYETLPQVEVIAVDDAGAPSEPVHVP